MEDFTYDIKNIKNTNIRPILYVDKISNLITIEEKDKNLLNACMDFDRLIIVSDGNSFMLCRISNFDKNEISLHHIMPVKIEKVIAKEFVFGLFSIFLPVVVLKDTFVFPYEINNLLIGREFSFNAVNYASFKDTPVIVTKQLSGIKDPITENDIHKEGVICSILQMNKIEEKTYKTSLEGKYRVNIRKIEHRQGTFFADAVLIFEEYLNPIDVYKTHFFEKLNLIKQKALHFEFPLDIEEQIKKTKDSFFFSFLIANTFFVDGNARLDIMRKKQSEIIQDLLIHMKEKSHYLDLEEQIDNKAKENLSMKSKKAWLQEKMNALNQQIQESDPGYDDSMKFLEDFSTWPAYVQEIYKKEKEKYSRYGNSTEGNMIYQHMEWIASLPWSTSLKRETDIEKIVEELNKSHVGSSDIKEKLIESINLRKPEESGFVILLIGPWGVGKTSIAESFAKAVGSPFQDISLSGMSDVTLLLGHGRTYVGSMPGKFVEALKRAKCKNPVIVLDEIDKTVRAGNKGDVQDALVRALDINHNHSFQDNYLGPKIDLSKVTWILTANSDEGINQTILDRCIKIYVNGYCVEEKIDIGFNGLSKIQAKLDIQNSEFEFSRESMLYLIENYTGESGVRRLMQLIERLIRKVIIELKKSKKRKKIVLDKNKIDEYLKFEYKYIDPVLVPDVGQVSGLAYTSQGGVQTTIQCFKTPSTEGNKHKIEITGNLKQVMKESIFVAIGYIKNNMEKLGIPTDTFDKYNFHIHAPAGGTPKDGPSAGVTICVAMVSAILNKKVRANCAMTGEIGLNGVVLPIGGLIEKLNAADRIRRHMKNIDKFTVYVPQTNMHFIKNQIHPSVTSNLEIKAVSHINEILEDVFEKTDN